MRACVRACVRASKRAIERVCVRVSVCARVRACVCFEGSCVLMDVYTEYVHACYALFRVRIYGQFK